MASAHQALKVRENRLRDTASRQGLRLVKSRRRDPRALDFGRFTLVNGDGEVVYDAGVDLDAIERYLTGTVRNCETNKVGDRRTA